MLRRPLHVVAYEKVEEPVAVVVNPHCRCAEAFALPQSARVCNVDKCAFAGVVKEPILPNAGDQDVWEAVIVVVSHRNPQAVEFHIQSGTGCDVSERSVSVVVVEAQRGAALLVAGPVHTIDQQNVLPAVAI